jgi:hypothetical protein
MENKIFKLKGLFYLKNTLPLYSGGVNAEKCEGYEHILHDDIIEKVSKDGYRWLHAKTDCWRGSHDGIIFEWFNGKRKFTKEDIEWFKKVVTEGGVIVGKKIIKTGRNLIIRFYRPTEEIYDPNPREIVTFQAEEGKDTNYTEKKHKYSLEGEGIIAWEQVRCCSRTCSHWTDFIIVVKYVDKDCRLNVKEKYTTCRGNFYENEKEIVCE